MGNIFFINIPITYFIILIIQTTLDVRYLISIKDYIRFTINKLIMNIIIKPGQRMYQI